jgi:hypothetical protein
MSNLNEQILKRVCAVLDKPCYQGRKDLLVLKLCEDISNGSCVVIDYTNKSIYSLHPTKQDV